MSEREPPTMAPWRVNAYMIWAGKRFLAQGVRATDDEMRLMAAALDLREALRARVDNHDEHGREKCGKDYECCCSWCQHDRALLAALPVLPK